MSYIPTTWETGDVITAEKLNNMESGIANGEDLFVITAMNVATETNPRTQPTLDKTFLEIADAIKAGKVVVLKINYEAEISFFVTEAMVIYNNSEIFNVLFNYNNVSISAQNKWHVINVGITIASNMTSSTFKETDLAT